MSLDHTQTVFMKQPLTIPAQLALAQPEGMPRMGRSAPAGSSGLGNPGPGFASIGIWLMSRVLEFRSASRWLSFRSCQSKPVFWASDLLPKCLARCRESTFQSCLSIRYRGQVNHANLLLLAARIVPEFLVFAGHSKPMQHCLIEVQVLVSMRTAGNPGPAQPLTLFLQVTI